METLVITPHQPIMMACKHFLPHAGRNGRAHWCHPERAWKVGFARTPKLVILDVEASHFQQSEQLYEALVSGDWFGEPIRDVLILASEPISWPVGVWLPKPFNALQLGGAMRRLGLGYQTKHDITPPS